MSARCIDEGEKGSPERLSVLPEVTQLDLEGERSQVLAKGVGREVSPCLSPSASGWDPGSAFCFGEKGGPCYLCASTW